MGTREGGGGQRTGEIFANATRSVTEQVVTFRRRVIAQAKENKIQVNGPIKRKDIGNKEQKADIPLRRKDIGSKGQKADIPLRRKDIGSKGQKADIPLRRKDIGSKGQKADIPLRRKDIGSKGQKADIPLRRKDIGHKEQRAVVVCWLLVKRPSNTLVYLRDGSAQTIARAATLRQKLQIKLSTSSSHSILTSGRPVPALTL